MVRHRTNAGRFTVATLTALLIVGSSPLAAHADSLRNREWFLASLRTQSANRVSEGAGITVAVIDSGVDSSHPDLEGNVLKGVDITTGQPGGYTDILGHGTQEAGLIAAHGHGRNLNDGALGVAPKASVLPIRDGGFLGNTRNVARAIEWAISHGAQVICLAEGGAQGSPELRSAVMDAERADIVVVAAAGNAPQDTRVLYPAAYPGVIAAAGTDEHGNHAAISVTGPQVVLSAPPTNIVSTDIHNGYGIGTGTSASTAIIAGAAALVRSKFPNLSAAEVVHRLEATAIDKGPPGRDDEYGYGELNIIGALTANVPPLTDTPNPSAATTRATRATPTSRPVPDRRSIPWLPLAAVIIALAAALAVWTAAHRGHH